MFYIELFRDKRKKWRSRIKAGNGKIIWSSEAYSSYSKCWKTIDSFREFINWEIKWIDRK